MQDFSALINWPDSLQNLLKTLCIESAPALLALAKSMRSSAKKRWEMPKLCFEAFRGVHSSLLQLSLSRYSIHRINKYGERGSPWRKPLVGIKGVSLPPLRRIEIEAVETQLIMSLINSSGNRNALRTLWMNDHSSQS